MRASSAVRRQRSAVFAGLFAELTTADCLAASARRTPSSQACVLRIGLWMRNYHL